MTLIYLAIAWLLGIVAADFFHPAAMPLVVMACAGALLAALLQRTSMRLPMLIICCAALGGLRYDWAQVETTPQSVWLLNEHGGVTLQGVVAEDPQWTEQGQRLLLSAERVLVNGKARRVEGAVLVTLPPYPARSYGDRLVLTGALKTPREAEQPGQFDYRAYLARKRVFSLMEPKTTKLVSSNNGSPFWSMLLHVRDHARRVLLRELPEPQASLAVGMLLGLQASIPDDVYNTFNLTGTSHILVISGWNISILAAMLAGAGRRLRLSHTTAFWLTLGVIWLYTLFVGATPTVIRAAVMSTIMLLGQRLDRPAHVWTTLFAACWAMTLYDPQTLWDLGFQLSALATASLFAFGKGVETRLLRTPLRLMPGWAREALTATLAAQILALPLILYQFGNLSVIAPVANVALLPVVSYAMLFGALALLVGMAYLPAGQIVAWLAYLPLAWLTEGARWFAQVPWAAVQIPPFPLWLLLAYYGVVVGAWLTHCIEIQLPFGSADEMIVPPGALPEGASS